MLPQIIEKIWRVCRIARIQFHKTMGIRSFRFYTLGGKLSAARHTYKAAKYYAALVADENDDNWGLANVVVFDPKRKRSREILNWLRYQWHRYRGHRSFYIQYRNGRINPYRFQHFSIAQNADRLGAKILFDPDHKLDVRKLNSEREREV